MQGEAAATESEDAASEAQDGRASPHTDNGSSCRSQDMVVLLLLNGLCRVAASQVTRKHQGRPPTSASVVRRIIVIDLDLEGEQGQVASRRLDRRPAMQCKCKRLDEVRVDQAGDRLPSGYERGRGGSLIVADQLDEGSA
jgi:hypothetical protein